MVDMALGLAKKAVEGTVSRVLAAIDEDKKLMASVKQDLGFIVGEFQMMESFLEMANHNKKRASNKVVKMWVRQLRELAFNVEDCVEFVIHVDTTSFCVRWLSWPWHLVPCLPSRMTPAWVRDLNQAFAQLKQIKAGVDEVSRRYTRYNLLGGDGDDSSSSNTLPPVVPPEQLYADAFPSTVNILRDLWKDTEKQSSSYKCNLQYLVTDPGCDKHLKVISVCRTAGLDLEAANILNAAYCDPEICKLLSKKKYLIILEGLSSAVEWDLISLYLPDYNNGSRIVISTEQLGFALRCVGDSYRVFQLALFPNDGYIYALSNKRARIDVTKLVSLLGYSRVISLWEDNSGDTTSVVQDVYNAIMNKTAEIKGINFENFAWVKVPNPFRLETMRGVAARSERHCACLILPVTCVETFYSKISSTGSTSLKHKQ